MTGSEFLAYVKKNFVRDDKDTEIYECTTDIVVDMRLRMLSDDYSTISADLNSSMSVGDYTIDVPTDFGHLLTDGILMRDTSSDDTYFPLRKVSKAYYDENNHDVYSSTVSNRNTGIPTYYAYYGRKIYLSPAVDKTTYEFKINYTTDGVTDITSGTATVPFTDKYRRILRDGVCMLLYKQLENYEEASQCELDYERGLRKIIRNDKYNVMDNWNMSYHG